MRPRSEGPISIEEREERHVADHEVVIWINQQQLELLDNTVAKGHASDRPALIRRALREFAANHPPAPTQAQRPGKS
jgi:hypothetical protein